MYVDLNQYEYLLKDSDEKFWKTKIKKSLNPSSVELNIIQSFGNVCKGRLFKVYLEIELPSLLKHRVFILQSTIFSPQITYNIQQ